jgi:hypothetical protein
MEQHQINEMNDGVAIILQRMTTHPEEFYNDSDKWKFVYKDYYREALTETEKGIIFDKIKAIRRSEFTAMVMSTMLKDIKMNEPESDAKPQAEQLYGKASVRGSGQKVRY